MKKLTLTTLTCLLTLSSMAQDYTPIMRDYILNTTDYSQNNMAIGPTRRVGKQSTAPFSAIGSPKIPVILVQFNDLKFTLGDKYQPQSEEGVTAAEVLENYQKFCNGTGIKGKPYRVSGGVYGSVSDYFIAQSDSLFQPEFTVIGPVTLSESYAYYGKGQKTDVNIHKFYSEACKLAVSQFDVEWSDFDNDQNNAIDMVYFIYAGRGENEEGADPNYIWPHEGTSSLTVTTESGNITFASYGCSAELVGLVDSKKNLVTQQDGIGTMCHEISHGLGLPDFYDTSGNKKACMDCWDLMDSGAYQMLGNQPCEYSAYERDFMGWRALKEIDAEESITLDLEPMSAGGFGYKITNPDDPSGNDYFIIENRQNIEFDMALGCPSIYYYTKYGPCHGLLVTHVQYDESAWSANRVNNLYSSTSKKRMTIVPADGELLSNLLTGFTDEYCTSLRGDLFPGNQEVETMLNNSAYPSLLAQIVTSIAESSDTKNVQVKINGGTTIPDAIEGVTVQNVHIQDIFSPSGQKVGELQKGLNIVRYSDGTVKKIIQ